MKRFLYCFNLAYKILLHTTFAEPLFDQIYNKIKYNIQVVINDFSYLKFIIDGSSNINHKQITNIFYFIKLGALRLSFQDIAAHIYDK